MNELQVFNFSGLDVRTVIINGEPWWVAKDVCDVLGLSNPSETMRRIDQEEKSTLRISEGGPEVNIINESGLYSCILCSNKPEAKEFKKWITSEVLPSIRKTGQFNTGNSELDMAKMTVYVLENMQSKIKELETKVLEDKPKVEFYDIVTASEDTVDMNEAAKILNFPGMGRTKLFSFLKDKKVLMQNKLPYQKYMDMGYFEISEQPFQTPDGVTHIYNKTVVTQKGLEFIKNLYNSWKYAN